MRTRILIILLLTLLLVGLVTVESIFVHSTIDYLKTESISLQTLIRESENIDTKTLQIKLNEFDEKWMEKENVLCLVINHKDMERVGEQIKKLKTLSRQNDKIQAEQEIDLLVYYISGYDHFAKISFQNIF